MLKRLGYGLSGGFKAPIGASSAYLDSVVASVCCDLDATQTDSYPGSGQTWANLIASPADGAAQTDYDFYLGFTATTDGDEPTFNGTAGDTTAYWSFDGGDRFGLKSGVNTAFLNNLHKTTGGSDFWVAYAWNHVDTTWQNRFFFSTYGYSTTNGLIVGEYAQETVGLTQYTSGAANKTTSFISGAPQGDHIAVASHSHSTNETTIWLDTASGRVMSHTFTTNTTDPTGALTISGGTNGGVPLSSEDKLYSMAFGNEYLDDTKAAAIIAHLETRHGRDYTP